MSPTQTELNTSKLGTKDHWDKVYEEELANFEDHGDEGEIWFGEDSVEKMVEWSLKTLPPPQDQSQNESQQKILEVGSGNGTLLFALAEAGYAPSSLHGIDYSQGAVQLARNISVTKGFAGSDAEREGKGKGLISFEESDFLTQDPPFPSSSSSEERVATWDLLLDKGTYDAIALGPKDSSTGRSPAVHYPGRVARLLKKGGYFLITSCNFTEEELTNAFVSDETNLVYQQVSSLFFIRQLTNFKKAPGFSTGPLPTAESQGASARA